MCLLFSVGSLSGERSVKAIGARWIDGCGCWCHKKGERRRAKGGRGKVALLTFAFTATKGDCDCDCDGDNTKDAQHSLPAQTEIQTQSFFELRVPHRQRL